MAIYSLNHKSIGKTTQDKPHTASAHVSYITRARACSQVLAERMPDAPGQAKTWLKEQENADRKNARIIDKVMVALPRELNAAQRAVLVQEYGETITQGRASWMAAIHDRDKDEQNPHCHIVIRDRDHETGKRVARLSDGAKDRRKAGLEPSSTDYLRQTWEACANRHLEMAHSPERINRRSLKAQGIERRPTQHVGVQAREMEARGLRPQSSTKEVKRRAVRRRETKQRDGATRPINYSQIDAGRTRSENNEAVKAEIARLVEKMRTDRKQEIPVMYKDEGRTDRIAALAHQEMLRVEQAEEKSKQQQLDRQKYEQEIAAAVEQKRQERDAKRQRSRDHGRDPYDIDGR